MRPFEARLSPPAIGEFTQPANPIAGSTLCPDVDRIFSLNPALESVVVQSSDGDFYLVDRHDFVHLMTGQYGYGRMLYQRAPIEEFLDPATTLSLKPSTTIVDANNALFALGDRFRQRNILVTDFGPTGVGVLSAVVLLREAARLHAQFALHDQLTTLPNRAMVTQRLNQLLRVPQNRRGIVALMFLDLDRFKNVNDSFGHNAGDSLLMAFGSRLVNQVGDIDLAARLGGDEFAVVAAGVASLAELDQLAERILAMTREPISFDGRDLVIDVSVGIAIADAHDDTTTLLRKADIAMYRAKRSGGNRYVTFEGDLDEVSKRRLDIETQLRQAITEEQLLVHYQPIIDCNTGALQGVEALVRWEHPSRGLMQPSAFLPVALETGIISEIDAYVLRRACRQLTEWRAQSAGYEDLFVSVNMSGQGLERADIVPEIHAILEETGLPAANLQIEITESSYISSIKVSADNLKAMKLLGIRIALDDFGTGYSSLNHLRYFPFDVLKIDRAFVTEASQHPEDAEIIRLVIALATAMNSSVTAEGVEREAEADLLREMGCGLAQGYLYSKPVAPEEIERLMREPARLAA